MSTKTVFLSYRRDAASKAFARSIKQALGQHGFDAFLDVDSVAPGRWAEQIEHEILQRAHFLLLLTPGALARCAEDGDWVRREYELAVQHKRNVVPVREESFVVDAECKTCPKSMRSVFGYQFATVAHASFDHDIETLVTRYLSRHEAPGETPWQPPDYLSDRELRRQAIKLGRQAIDNGRGLLRQHVDLLGPAEAFRTGFQLLYGFSLDEIGWPDPPLIEDPVLAASDFRCLGDLLRKLRDRRALAVYQIADDLFAAAGNSPDAKSERGKLHSSLADACLRFAPTDADLQKALHYALQSIELHRDPVNAFELFQSFRILADVRLALGQPIQAEEAQNEAEQYWKQSHAASDPARRKLIGWLHRSRGDLCALRGSWTAAREQYDAARALFQTDRDQLGLALALAMLSAVDRQRGATHDADEEFARAEEASRSVPGADNLQERLRRMVRLGRIGVASSVTCEKETFDSLLALEYAARHGFAPVQLYLDQRLIADGRLRKAVLGRAQEFHLPLIVHAPGLLTSSEATNSALTDAALELLAHEERKRVIYHFDESRSVDNSLAAAESLCAKGIVPCIENFHHLGGPENARRNYTKYLELLSRIHDRELPAVAVIDIPRTFHERLGLPDEECCQLVVDVLRQIGSMGFHVLLHLIDSATPAQSRSDWRPLGRGAIPYTRIFEEVNGKVPFEDVVLEFENREDPLPSREFLWKLTVPS